MCPVHASLAASGFEGDPWAGRSILFCILVCRLSQNLIDTVKGDFQKAHPNAPVSSPAPVPGVTQPPQPTAGEHSWQRVAGMRRFSIPCAFF